MIWFLISLDLHRALRHDLHLASQRQVHDATMKKLHVSQNEGNLPYRHHHITSHAPLQNKVRRVYLLSFCKFYVAARAFEEEPFLTYEH